VVTAPWNIDGHNDIDIYANVALGVDANGGGRFNTDMIAMSIGATTSRSLMAS
jgi:hypothetical protein